MYAFLRRRLVFFRHVSLCEFTFFSLFSFAYSPWTSRRRTGTGNLGEDPRERSMDEEMGMGIGIRCRVGTGRFMASSLV